MTIRYYILPIERLPFRKPKYFSWRGSPGISCPWSMKDYGDIDQAIICADILAADHTALIANADVLSIPVNVDSALTVSARNTARTFLETYNIPAGWINTGMTYRAVLRTITAFFLYMQRVTGLLGHGITLPVGWADLTMTQVPADIRDAMTQAAASFGYDYSWVTGTTTVRQVLKGMADAWGVQPILFGLAAL
jgi:hypothetical protein